MIYPTSTNTDIANWNIVTNFMRNVANDQRTSGVKTIATYDADHIISANEEILLMDATAGDVSVFFPPASSIKGRSFTIIKIDASGNQVILDPSGAELINGAPDDATTTQWLSRQVISDGFALYIV